MYKFPRCEECQGRDKKEKNDDAGDAAVNDKRGSNLVFLHHRLLEINNYNLKTSVGFNNVRFKIRMKVAFINIRMDGKKSIHHTGTRT